MLQQHDMVMFTKPCANVYLKNSKIIKNENANI
jgi:hypothetical protein